MKAAKMTVRKTGLSRAVISHVRDFVIAFNKMKTLVPGLRIPCVRGEFCLLLTV